jgi:uncharacterized protein YjbJ (UPF0337 family)
MDDNRIEGSAKKLKGDLKAATGRALGDSKLEAEGSADRTEGRVQNAVGGIKDALTGRNRDRI